MIYCVSYLAEQIFFYIITQQTPLILRQGRRTTHCNRLFLHPMIVGLSRGPVQRYDADGAHDATRGGSSGNDDPEALEGEVQDVLTFQSGWLALCNLVRSYVRSAVTVGDKPFRDYQLSTNLELTPLLVCVANESDARIHMVFLVSSMRLLWQCQYALCSLFFLDLPASGFVRLTNAVLIAYFCILPSYNNSA